MIIIDNYIKLLIFINSSEQHYKYPSYLLEK
jgi:hypothetical protein